MMQAGPMITFVCEDHPNQLGCECVAEMISETAETQRERDILKRLNFDLQKQLLEKKDLEADYNNLRTMLKDGLNRIWDKTRLTIGIGSLLRDLLRDHEIDPDTLKIKED